MVAGNSLMNGHLHKKFLWTCGVHSPHSIPTANDLCFITHRNVRHPKMPRANDKSAGSDKCSHFFVKKKHVDFPCACTVKFAHLGCAFPANPSISFGLKTA